MEMSQSGKPSCEIGLDALTSQFRDSLCCEANKPDFRKLDLGSPVSPLRTRKIGVLPAVSSSSSSSGSLSDRDGNNLAVKRSDSGLNNHSGELSGSSDSSPTAADSNRSADTSRKSKSIHTKYDSGTASSLLNSAQSAVNSPAPVNVLPSGNICPSGKIMKASTTVNKSSRAEVLGSGSGNYGHGSIMRGGGATKSSTIGTTSPAKSKGSFRVGPFDSVKRAMASSDPEEVKRAGNEQYKRGHFVEALNLYDRAIALSPKNAAYRSNRAAALTGLRRLGEAIRECEDAVKLDPNYGRAHHRLGSLFLRLGIVENARKHLCHPTAEPDPFELQKLETIEKHLIKCGEARHIRDWKSVLREVDAAITSGVDFSPQLFTCRVESLLKLHRIEEAESGMLNIPKLDSSVDSWLQSRFCGILSEAYLSFVRAQIDIAVGRFENAVTNAEKAGRIDPRSVEISVLAKNVQLVARARSRGNDLFKLERFTEACSAYDEGLKLDPSNSVLFCNRAACWMKLGRWERSIEDCNQALCIQPHYTKALLRRAVSNSKLERWAEAVRDFEVMRAALPDDKEVAESLFHAQVSLKKSLGEEVHKVEPVSGLEMFKAAISFPGVSIVHFRAPSNAQCKQILPIVETLCSRYPSINFLQVDIEENPNLANVESVRIAPTFKIYKNGSRVKEMVCPSREMLELSVRYYSF